MNIPLLIDNKLEIIDCELSNYIGMNKNIHCNIHNDAKLQFIDLFNKHSINFSNKNNLDEICLYYFNIKHKMIMAKPRAVEISKELDRKISNKKITDEEISLIENIISEIKMGEDLSPRLSKWIVEPILNDYLLNDWGIHHLHINNKTNSNYFVKRSGKLLFIIVRQDKIYLLDLLDHLTHNFANRKLLDIIEGSFFNLIKPNYLGNSSYVPNANNILEIRKKHIGSLMVLSNGNIYLPLGKGFDHNGVASEAIYYKRNFLSKIDFLQKVCNLMNPSIQDKISKIKNKNVELNCNLRLIDIQGELDQIPEIYLTFSAKT